MSDNLSYTDASFAYAAPGPMRRRPHWDLYLDWGCWMVGVNVGNGRHYFLYFYLHVGPLVCGVWWERVPR